MSDAFASILAGTAGLDLAAAVALWLTVVRGPIVASDAALRKTMVVATLTLACQAAHFAEELRTGFASRFPGFLGLSAWPPSFFLSFNLLWIVLWGVSIPALGARWRAALFPLWFLAIASLANGLAHPLLTAATRSYFPGLLTSPLVLVAGFLLVRRLSTATDPRAH
jgi:hypothetical protein